MNGDIEGFGIAFLEAAAHGLPAVASDEGGVQEAVLSGQTGLVVTSVDGAARALIALSRDPALRSRLGEAGRKYARTMTWSARAEMLLSLLQQPS
jgi:glycosyltransferase involved in cell wall biosynthesis